MQYLYKNYSSEFIIEPTKYSKYYQLIIDRALSEQRTKLKKDHTSYVYYENHHILPKSLFPEFSKLKDNPWNSVILTAREHYLVHALIYKHFKSLKHQWKYKLGRALFAMSNLFKNKRYNSKSYAYYKESRTLSSTHKENIGNSRRGKPVNRLAPHRTGFTHTEETKNKMSNSHKGKEFSEEHRKNLSKYAKNRTQEHLDKINKSREKSFTDEYRENQRLKAKGRINIYHLELQRNKRVFPQDVDSFISEGWIIGVMNFKKLISV